MLNRRTFLTATLAGAGGTLLAGCTPSTAARTTEVPAGPYRTVTLGKTGIQTSLIGIGTGMHGGRRQSDHTRMGREKFEALLKGCYERGIRMFDMADLYGTHTYIARAMKDVPREKLTYVTKIWVRPGGIPEKERPPANVVIDRFRKELDTDYIDLVQIHCMTDPKWTDEQRRQMDIMEDLKAKGVIRAHGVSIHSLAALKTAAEDPWVDVIHARTNAYGVKMDAGPEKVATVLAKAAAGGKGILGMKLVGEGKFRNDPDKKDASIRWAMGPGHANAMVVGFLAEDEVDDFARRVERLVQPVAAKA
jgi:aryl-alcohol dehydrogenase-like predicted oxidoreductase